MKFTRGTQKKAAYKLASAHIVKKKDAKSYVALTSRLNLHYKVEDGGEPYELQGGMFFLQRVDKKPLARFVFDKTGIDHLQNNLEFDDRVHFDG